MQLAESFHIYYYRFLQDKIRNFEGKTNRKRLRRIRIFRGDSCVEKHEFYGRFLFFSNRIESRINRQLIHAVMCLQEEHYG